MLCTCGTTVEVKKFSTFEYNYCPNCKIEVSFDVAISAAIASAITTNKNKYFLVVSSSDTVLDTIMSDLNASVNLEEVTCTLYFIHSDAQEKMRGYRIDEVFAEQGIDISIPAPRTYFNSSNMKVIS